MCGSDISIEVKYSRNNKCKSLNYIARNHSKSASRTLSCDISVEYCEDHWKLWVKYVQKANIVRAFTALYASRGFCNLLKWFNRKMHGDCIMAMRVHGTWLEKWPNRGDKVSLCNCDSGKSATILYMIFLLARLDGVCLCELRMQICNIPFRWSPQPSERMSSMNHLLNQKQITFRARRWGRLQFLSLHPHSTSYYCSRWFFSQLNFAVKRKVSLNWFF